MGFEHGSPAAKALADDYFGDYTTQYIPIFWGYLVIIIIQKGIMEFSRGG